MQYNIEVDMSDPESYFFKLPRDFQVKSASGKIVGEHELILTIDGETHNVEDKVFFKLGVCAPDDNDVSDSLKTMPKDAIILATKYFGTNEIQGPRIIAYLDPTDRMEPWFDIKEMRKLVS